MVQSGINEGKPSRRRVLQWMALAAIGGGVLLAANRLTGTTPRVQAEENSANVAPSQSVSETKATGASPLKVKAVYFQMSRTIGTDHEYFILQSPAFLRDLLNNIAIRHASMSLMMPTMITLIDGVPAQPSASLKDGDEVDFIPLFAGG